MDHYCPLVSPDCYCIVEDTKMSRWASTGPLESVKKFMAGKHGKDFTVVRHGHGGDTACSHVNPSTIPWFTQDAGDQRCTWYSHRVCGFEPGQTLPCLA